MNMTIGHTPKTQLDYGTAGYRGLSYSRRSTLHTCARKFQLENALGFATRSDSVTFAYGHAVAAGIQEYLHSGSLTQAKIAVTSAYTMPWSDLGTIKEQRAKKSVWYALRSLTKFTQRIQQEIYGELSELSQYELAYIQVDGKEVPAIELQFRVQLHDGFVYEGHIDLILRHRTTGEFVIVEIKTSGLNDPHEALFANSDQALSYSIVLDRLVQDHEVVTYKVFYLIYASPKQDWILMTFVKSAKKRFDWINNLVRDCELIEYYQSTSDEIPYPTNGSSCYEYFSPCKYFGTCDMENENLELIYRQPDSGTEQHGFEYVDNTHFSFTLDEIIERQIALAESRAGIELTTPELTQYIDEI